MSRVIILGLDNKSIGEFDAICNLGYSLCGNPAISPGGSAGIAIPEYVFTKDWLEFGHAIVVQPEDAPAYFGLIDTPWIATRPVGITVYDVEYLLSLRTPDAKVKLTGHVASIISKVIDLFNAQGDMFIRLGSVGQIDSTYREETLDTRSFWEQLQALAVRAKTEMIFRPEKNDEGRWMIYVDLAQTLGADIDFEIQDGEQGNMKVNNAQVRGEIINRVIGIGSQSTQQSLLTTAALLNEGSSNQYRTRSRVVQFRDVSNANTLNQNTKNYLNVVGFPYLEMQVSVVNDDHAFRYLRPGNAVMAHASQIVLPRGVKGWRGKTRIMKMALNDATKTMNMTLTGGLYQ